MDDLISRAAAIGCLGNSPEEMCMPWSEMERMLREQQPESEIIDAITNWIKSNIAYDYIRAATIPKWGNVLPDIDRCFDQRRGICLDIAGMMVAMLRSRYIASRLEIGKCGRMNHAWVRLADGTLYDPTRDMVAQTRGRNCYKLERFY